MTNWIAYHKECESKGLVPYLELCECPLCLDFEAYCNAQDAADANDTEDDILL
jgi:hypothetical protein